MYKGTAQVHFIFARKYKKSEILYITWLNVVRVIPFITVAKSKMYWQGVKNTVLGLNFYTKMSPKLKCHQIWNVTKTEVSSKLSPKLRCHQKWNITKTEMLPNIIMSSKIKIKIQKIGTEYLDLVFTYCWDILQNRPSFTWSIISLNKGFLF